MNTPSLVGSQHSKTKVTVFIWDSDLEKLREAAQKHNLTMSQALSRAINMQDQVDDYKGRDFDLLLERDGIYRRLIVR